MDENDPHVAEFNHLDGAQAGWCTFTACIYVCCYQVRARLSYIHALWLLLIFFYFIFFRFLIIILAIQLAGPSLEIIPVP